MSLETSIRECGASLSSVRATDRKKNGENLKNFLTGNAAPALLTENTLLSKGYTWNHLFDDINDLVHKETEKYESSKNFNTVMGPLCSNLLHLCVSGSNKGEAYIKCDKIIDACLFVLRDDRLAKAIGDAYLNILYKHVLTNDHYLCHMTPSAWEELLDVCLLICSSNHSKLDSYTKLRLLLLVMKNGNNYCQFVVPLRDCLTRLKKCFLKVVEDKKVQEVVVEIIILLLETLSTESRLTMCEFTEVLMSQILKFREQNFDHKKKTTFFKLLNMTITLHHPLGTTRGESGSLAKSWDVWSRYLHSILEVVCLEVAYLQKQQIQRKQDNLLKYSTEFFALAASTYFQMFNIFSNKVEEGESSSKKQRITFNKNKTFGDLIEELKQSHMPWLAIIHIYVKKYGQFVSADNYILLLRVLESHVNSSGNLDWNAFEGVSCLVVKNLSSHSVSSNEAQDVLLLMWNSCVRNSTLVNTAHKSVHAIMQHILNIEVLKYQNVQPLLKMYYGKGMPVTDHSLTTLNYLWHKFFSKCSHLEQRISIFNWFTQVPITSLEVGTIKRLLLQLLCTENIDLLICEPDPQYLNHYDVIFNSVQKNILYNEFEHDIIGPKVIPRQAVEKYEMNSVLNKEFKDYFELQLSQHTLKLNNKEVPLLVYIKLLNIVIDYVDITFRNNLTNHEDIESEELFPLIRTGLRNMYYALIKTFKDDNARTIDQIKLLDGVKSIMVGDYDSLLCSELRKIDKDFFQCINDIINRKKPADEGVVYEEDDSMMNPQALRHASICVLAAFCRKSTTDRKTVLDFVLDPKIYNFNTSWDTLCALDCIKLLSEDTIEEAPLESIFVLMQGMCKDLFKNPEATFSLLKIFGQMLEKFWHFENGKQNCCILVRGYLQRCEKKYYPPYVAAMIYECAARIALITLIEKDPIRIFVDAVQNKIKGEVHNIRLYCCYLMKFFTPYLPSREISDYFSSLAEIFVIKVAERQELILKDESVNRSVTILRYFLTIAETRKSLIYEIVTEIVNMHNEKSLEKVLVKKVLNKITNTVASKSVESYFNDNALFIINYWFSKGNSLNNLPLHLFGYDRVETFLEKHLKWVIPADILWRKAGNIADSDVLKFVQEKSGKSAESIIQACISQFIVLNLPYVVTEKYGLDYSAPGKREWSLHAQKMFESTRQILGANNWSNLFVENLSQLMVLIASQLSDPYETKNKYNVNVPLQIKSYEYPKIVFLGILTHMGELIEEDILIHLCENQALAIFKVLFHLWANVLDEKVYEYRVLRLQSFVMFLENIPLEQPTDGFVCNFACNSLTHAIINSPEKQEIRVFVIALKSILEKILPEKVDIVRKPVLELLSILMIKKEEGFDLECAPLFNYLTIDMKEYLRESEDVVDFISSLSQASSTFVNSSTKMEFLEKLKTYRKSLMCPSRETLTSMHQYLKLNKRYINSLCEEFNSKGFSDDCGTSTIHQIIYSLSNTLKSTTDDKTIIEACNCLAEIGNYDLKTLVTVPPPDTQRITNMPPKQYFAIVVMTALSDILFDADPNVTNAVSKTLKRLLQYREGNFALDLDEVDKQILMPLASSNCDAFAEFKVNIMKLNTLCADAFCLPQSNETHSQWLTRMTTALIEVLASQTNYLSGLHAVCLSKPNVCRKIISQLIGLVVECSEENQIELISEQINRFFKYVWELNFQNSIESSEESVNRKKSVPLDRNFKMIVLYMLDVVNFVRVQRNHYTKRAEQSMESLNYFRLDYDKVAWAATLADQNLAAIYYAELWALEQNDGVPPASPEATSQLTGGEDVQRILRKCFVSIGEMDAIDGCGTAHLTSEEEMRKHLINTGQFSDALLLHDIALSCGSQVDPRLQHGLVKSLHKSGMHHLSLQYIKSLPENDALNDIKYDCLSFLGDWTEFVDTRELEDKSNCNPYSVLKAYRYSCLKDCLNLQTTPDFDTKLVEPLNRAKRAIARLCQNLNMENCQNVYKVLSKLHLFSDIEDYFQVRCNKMPLKSLLNRWQVDNLPAYKDFKHLEDLISQRSLLLEHAAKMCRSLPEVVSLQIKYSELSLSNERVQMAQRLLAVVKKVSSSQEVVLADSQISWAKGNKDIALSLLRNIILKPNPDVTLTAVSLRQYGVWMAESKRDNARDIINKYLKKSLDVLKGTENTETRRKVYYDIANFADSEYKQVVAYMNSSVFEKKLQCLEIMKGAASSLRSTQDLSKDERKALTVNDKLGQIDEAEIAGTKAEKETFLQLAMRYYLLSLKNEANNLSVFRVISLWFDNPAIQLADFDASFEDLLSAIPSRKFITVLPQLAPRLTNEKCPFADNLKKVIKRCALEHPHHTLPILFSLKNSYKDKAKDGEKAGRGRALEPRVTAAEALVARLATEDTHLAGIIHQMEKLCDATISFANYLPQTKEMRQKIPSSERIHKLGHLDAIPVPTVTIPISYDCRYLDIPTLYSFENYFELVGGINCPKKISCRSSDGLSRILLIKGEDDLRQDAVMQQVFNIVNTLLEKDHVTSRNKLLIRTYKVVPMSRRSGVLEWCGGTMPIGTYLIGNTGAHARYRPQDISAATARNYMATYHKERRSNEDKLVLFVRILKEFRPVFHYFFTEHYLDTVTWYERRLAYTKSVASSSMIGYILGLGDRHLQNILIDKKTAEVIHIDFGIAFDQGKTLPTPETIPFRLTQDIVSGFGLSGVEGLFRRSCEKTMQLLRDNQETLLTILEVLLCDPLYTWSVCSKQQNVLPAQSKDTTVNHSSTDGSLAKRALLSVSSKLSGTEGGVAGGVAVPGQVARLIHSAMDLANLSRLYPGWQPFL